MKRRSRTKGQIYAALQPGTVGIYLTTSINVLRAVALGLM